MHDVAPQDACHCSRRHFATSSRVRAAPFSPRSERTATRQPCGRSGVRPLNYTASLLTCPRRHAPTMKIGMITDSLPEADFDTMLGVAARLEMDMLEFGCGNWSSAPHIDLDGMLESATARREFLRPAGRPRHRDQRAQLLRQSRASGRRRTPARRSDAQDHSPRAPAGRRSRRHDVGMPRRARRPARQLDHDRVATRGARDRPLAMGRGADPLLARPHVAMRATRASPRLCLELHGYQNVYSVATLKRLRDAVGDTVGANLDPSHLMWMGADPLAAARALGDAIYYVHAKDTRIEPVDCRRQRRDRHHARQRVRIACVELHHARTRSRRELVARLRRDAGRRRLRRRAQHRARGSGDERRRRRRRVGRRCCGA